MCGISGIVSSKIIQNLDYKSKLKNMTDAMQHRGPDDEGMEFFENCFLGFRRLSIVDTSSAGHQPMYSQHKNSCIVFNGEVYGYRELKKTINNYTFKSNTDTELVLALYENYGADLLQKITGMFAFAIWDEKEQQIFAARDRFGEKPFYYAFGKNGEFIFASEIKSILATNLIDEEINPDAIFHYLRHAFVSSQQSIYKNIFVLPPSHFLIYKNGNLEIKSYYNLEKQEIKIDENIAVEQLKELTHQSVEKQLVADVPVGVFLSGGLDSGTMVALSSQYSPNITTLGFAYEGDWNEMPQARQIAEKYNTNHHEVFLEENRISEILQKILTNLDEPLADTSIVATYAICEKAKEKMTVVITGNAGDELFGGYKWYQQELAFLESGNTPEFLLPVFKVGSLLSKKLGFKKLNSSLLEKINRAKYRNIIDFHQRKVHQFFSKDEVQRLLKSGSDFEHQYSFKLDEKNLNTCLKMDLTNVLPGSYMVKDDRISMMHSIELRTPFLDKNLVEFCVSLPCQYKISTTQTKKILRKAFGDFLTEDILNKKKQGFGAPVAKWLKLKEMESFTEEILKNPTSKIYQFLNFNEVQKYLDYTYKHWVLLVLGLWFEKH